MRKTNLFYCLFLFSIFTEGGLLAQSHWDAELKRAQKLSYTQLDSALIIADYVRVIGQTLDSPKLSFRAFSTLGLIHEDNNNLIEAQKNYAQALDLAEKKLSTADKLKSYTDWAIVHKKLGQYNIAYDYHWRTIKEATKIQDWKNVENGYHGLGTMYSMMSDFSKSAESYMASMEAAQKWNNQKGIVLTRQNLGNIFNKAKNYDMALTNIKIAYDMAQKLGDSVRIGAVLGIYGNIDISMGRLDSAINKLQTAAGIFEKRQDKPRLADIYQSLAGIYMQQGKNAEAELFFNKSADVQTFSSRYAYADLYQKRGQFYLSQNQLDNAKIMFSHSLRSTDSFGFKEIARANHLALATIFQTERRFDSAFYQQKQADVLGESLFADAKQKAMQEAQFKFDVKTRDLQIQAQNEQLRQSKILRGVLLGGLAVLIGLLFFLWQQMKAKQALALRAELMMKELHHRVKNNLQTLASIMRLQTRKTTDPSVAAMLNESRSRLEAISMIHQQFYRDEDVKTVNFRPFIEDLIEKLRFMYGMNDRPFHKELVISDTPPNVDVALSIGLIINELLTNSFKYAYPTLCEPHLRIEISDKSFIFTDNGQGLPKGFIWGKDDGFGMQLIQSLVKQLKGSFKVSNEGGFRFEMTICNKIM